MVAGGGGRRTVTGGKQRRVAHAAASWTPPLIRRNAGTPKAYIDTREQYAALNSASVDTAEHITLPR